jgi:ribosomal-protein-alanine N-acetyltransferase
MLREILPADSPLLSALHRRCFDDGWDARSFREMLSQDVFFGFLSLRKTAQGFIVGKIVCDEMEIITFCVLPEFRNRGVGKKLIEKIEGRARDRHVKTVFLEVSEGNSAARKIYENSGYVEVARRFGYYHTKDGDFSATVMRKTF